MLGRLDVGAWIGIVALVLSVPVGVVSHMIYNSLQRTLERRKLIKTDQTRLQAIQAYNHVKAFHNRTRDKYAYYLLLVGWAAICAVASAEMTILLFVLHPNIHFQTEYEPPLPPDIWVFVLLILAIIFALFAVLFMISLYSTSRHLEHFDAYKKDVEDRWGPIDVDDTPK